MSNHHTHNGLISSAPINRKADFMGSRVTQRPAHKRESHIGFKKPCTFAFYVSLHPIGPRIHRSVESHFFGSGNIGWSRRTGAALAIEIL
jgi:hypothetical protein